ncbi:MAG: SDR family oxidoreductase [Cytophagales bacterium]|jgi:hypothetical protein|nr:SDR family oxidoreductase [Cytophagales bacterium]
MNQTALITGASSGIGYELARIFAREGYNLIIVGRHQGTLQTVAENLEREFGGRVIPIASDLSKPESPDQLYREVQSRNLRVDVLVNDAGMGEHGFFTETDLRKELEIIQLNIASLVHLTKLFLKEMVARNNGKVLQLASIAGTMPNPLMAVYGATKAFVLSFSEALSEELKDTNVTMTALLPGATDTDFFNKAGAEETNAAEMAKSNDAAKVAQDGFDALMKGDRKVVSGFMNKVQVAMANVLPDSVSAKNMSKLMEEKENAPQQAKR